MATLKSLPSLLKHELLIPGFMILIYIIFMVAIRQSLPPSEEIIASLALLFDKYGYQIIFISAILEAIILVNIFIPGMLAMASGVVFARSGSLELPLVILAALAGVIVGYILDYGLGYFGFSKVISSLGYEGFLVRSRDKLNQFGNWALILGFSYSTVAAFLSLTAGTIRMNFIHFISMAILSSLFWLTAAALVIYSFGEVILQILAKYSFLIILVIILAFTLTKVGGKRVQ